MSNHCLLCHTVRDSFQFQKSWLRTVLRIMLYILLQTLQSKNAKGRHAKTRRMVILAGFRVVNFRPAWQKHDRYKPKIWWLICAVPYYRVFGAKRRKGATRQPAKWPLFSCFRVTTFRPAIRKNDTFHSSHFRLLFVVSLARLKVATRKPAKITI